MAQKEDPLDEALHELKGIIAMIQANLFKMVSVREIKESNIILAKIQKAVDKFEKKSFAELKEFGMTREQKDQIDEGIVPKNIKGEYKEALETILSLKKKIADMQKIAHREQGLLEEPDEQNKPDEKKNDKPLSKQKHKKKYKPLGTDDWKPL